MRVFKFMFIDIIKVKKLSWVFLFPLLAVVMMLRVSGDGQALFTFLYCLLGGIVVASFPLSEESASESGFLKMLPAKKGEAIKGHFLFALLSMLLFGILGIISVEIGRLFNSAITFGLISLYPLSLAVSVLVAALENVLLCGFHFENGQAQNILRIIPAFIFFFGGQILLTRLPKLVSGFAAWITMTKSLVLLIICLIIFWAIAEACAFFFGNRDEV